MPGVWTTQKSTISSGWSLSRPASEKLWRKRAFVCASQAWLSAQKCPQHIRLATWLDVTVLNITNWCFQPITGMNKFWQPEILNKWLSKPPDEYSIGDVFFGFLAAWNQFYWELSWLVPGPTLWMMPLKWFSGLLRLMVDSSGTLRALFLAEPEERNLEHRLKRVVRWFTHRKASILQMFQWLEVTRATKPGPFSHKLHP